MSTYTGADIVVSHTDKSYLPLPYPIRKFRKVGKSNSFSDGDKIDGYRKVLRNHLIDTPFHFLQFLFRRLTGQEIVALAFLPFDMGVTGTRTTKEAYHRSIQDMFGRMHRRVLRFVVDKLHLMFGRDRFGRST
jgi:hypothetical protein